MTAKTIDFICDFGSPNAYLSLNELREVAERTGATVRLIPCLLGGIFKATGNQAPFIAFGHIKNKTAYEALEMQRFVAKHGLDRYRFNPYFPMNTLQLMRGMLVAQHAGVADRYLDAVLAGMWEDGRKMDDPEVLAATQDPAVKAELVANTEAAVARGVFGIPTFFVGDEMFFGKERLGQLEDCLNAG